MKNSQAFAISFVIFVSTLTICNQLFAFSATYDQKVSIQGNPVATIKVTAKDQKLKAESELGGISSVMLRNETGTYSYLPTQKIATKIPPQMQRPNITTQIPQFAEYLKQNNGKAAGSEKVAGYDCDVFTFTEPITKKDAKAWVWKEKQFPVKVEVNAAEGKTTIEMSNIKLNAAIDDSTFKLPADVKVMDFPAPGAMPAVGAAPSESAPTKS